MTKGLPWNFQSAGIVRCFGAGSIHRAGVIRGAGPFGPKPGRHPAKWSGVGGRKTLEFDRNWCIANGRPAVVRGFFRNRIQNVQIDDAPPACIVI